ncbi:hypothetical protein VTO73DRAFT_7155 [Trametes versicolor]
MSLITVNRAILHSVWPNDLGRASQQTKNMQVRNSWRFVPEDFDTLCDWATIEDDEGDSTEGRSIKHLVYDSSVLPEGQVGGPFVVTVVLQGFLGESSLATLGNWRGKEADAPHAVHCLKLHSGGCDVAFSAQRRVLDDLRHLIHMQVGGDVRVVDDDPNTISLRRAVFSKVRATTGQAPGILLNDTNDPFKAARKIATRWRIDHVIDTSVRRPNGANMRVAADVLKTGDFVEVSVAANIRLMCSRKRRETVVEFCMYDVVRLWTAKEAKVRYARTDNAPENVAGPSRKPQVARIGSVQYGMPVPEEAMMLDGPAAE